MDYGLPHRETTVRRDEERHTSDTPLSSTGVPQGSVLAPFLFTLCASDFQCHSELGHIQKHSDNTVIVGRHLV